MMQEFIGRLTTLVWFWVVGMSVLCVVCMFIPEQDYIRNKKKKGTVIAGLCQTIAVLSSLAYLLGALK